MSSNENTFDAGIVGGGLAGLTAAIQLAQKGHSVILFEKEKYPFHRVCGEYISLESKPFLESLGLFPDRFGASSIRTLEVTAQNGKTLVQTLPLGGFGISRYVLDQALATIARESGVTIMEHTTVNDVAYNDGVFSFSTVRGIFQSRAALGSYGKRGKQDIRWRRPFITARKNKLNNFIGIKYHVRANYPNDRIALHNFPGGYCGIVKVEGDAYCLCYLTTAANLQKSGGDIHTMEQTILSKNAHLKHFLDTSERIREEPVVISQISFDKKSQLEYHVLLAGDTAGMITPLCGNGMSMAMHGGKIASTLIDRFLKNEITLETMEREYARQWHQSFDARLKMGRRMQRWFASNRMMNRLIGIGKLSPSITRSLIRKTHGEKF